MRRSLLPGCFLAATLLLSPRLSLAQAESREGIFLQNQILQLRQELEQMRAGGSSLGNAPRVAPPAAGGAAGNPEIIGQLLARVTALEEQVRRLNGRLDEAEFRDRQAQQNLEKLQQDMDYRLQQLEGQGAAARPATPAAPARPAAPAAAPAPAPAHAAPRTPERAISDGQAALGRRDYDGAEAAAREVLGNRAQSRNVDAQMLLADALLGKRNFGAAAVAYDDAFQRGRTGTRAPEALNGLAASFLGLNNRRDACNTLDDLRSNFPNLRGPQAERAAALRQRASCR